MGSNRRKGYRRKREGSLAPVFGGILVLFSIAYLGFGDRIVAAVRPAPAPIPASAPAQSEPPPKRILVAETDPLVVEIQNATLTLEPGAKMVVPGRVPPASRPVEVELLEGTVFTQVGYRLTDAPFTITSFNAGAGVRGTSFRVRVVGRVRTEVEVVEGVVEVWNGADRAASIYLRGGETARIAGSDSPVRDVKSRDWLSRVWPEDPYVRRRGAAAPAYGSGPGSGTSGTSRLARDPVRAGGDGRIGSSPRSGEGSPPAASASASPAAASSVGAPGSNIDAEAEILRTYREREGAGAREALLRSYRRNEGRTAAEVAARGDLDAPEREALRAVGGAAGAGSLDAGYRRYDRMDTAALQDLYRSQGGTP